MAILGEVNQAFSGDNEETMTCETSHSHTVQIDDYDDTNAMNMMTNSYEYYSKFNMYGDMNPKDAEIYDALDTIKMNNSSTSCCIDIYDDSKTKNTNSTTDNNTYEEYSYCTISYSKNCDPGVDTDIVKEKTMSSSRCSISDSCNEIITDTNLGRIYYNCNRSDPRLKLKIFPDTSLTEAVPSTTCCDCESGTSLENTDLNLVANINCKEKALVSPVKDEESQYCCKCNIPREGQSVLTRTLTEHSIKSVTDDLPSYRSLIAFRLQDSPPNYESVTGIRVNVDEIRKDASSYTRNRLRREVRTCSDLNSSAKRLLVLMAAIIIAICIVMIILTI